MIRAENAQHPVSQKTQTARELQLKLFHEIGIAAVAAALAARAKQREPVAELEPADVGSPRSDDDLAA